MPRQYKDIDERLKEMGYEGLSYPNMTASVELLDELLTTIEIFRNEHGELTVEVLEKYI